MQNFIVAWTYVPRYTVKQGSPNYGLRRHFVKIEENDIGTIHLLIW